MIEKSSAAYEDFQAKTADEIVKLFMDGKISKEKYMDLMKSLAGDNKDDQQAC